MTTSPPPFDDCLFSLSVISRRLDFPRSHKHSSRRQRHLKLLDFLALLMTTEPNDVAATTLVRTTSAVTILFSKNRPCTAPESSYIQALQGIITTRETSSIEDTRLRALSLVIDNCSRRIKARLDKFVDRLEYLQKSGFKVKPPPPHTSNILWKRLRPTGLPPGASLEKSITHWLTNLLKAPTSALGGTQAIVTLFIAHAIGYAQGIDSVIDDPVLLRRLQKLGDYFAAVCCLVRGYRGLEPGLTVTVREIAPPPLECITLKYDILGTVNAWACHRGHHSLTQESLLSAYPSLAPSYLSVPSTYRIVSPDNPPLRTVMTSVHAECTLLMHLLTLNLPLLEFGTSKNVCWTCRCFFAAIEKSYTGGIRFPGRRGKVHAGWGFPDPGGDVGGTEGHSGADLEP